MATEARSSTSRRRASAEERRAQILAAALRCFAARGYHPATMDDLAREAGLSKGSLYWHFDSKLDVFLGLFDQFSAQIFESWDALEQSELPVLSILEAQLTGAIEVLLAERELVMAWAEFLAQPEGRSRMAGVYEMTRGRLRRIVESGIARGELRDVDPGAAACMLLACGEGLALQVMVDPAFEGTGELEAMWGVIRGGLAS